jgi:hypothetical protein
MLWWINTLIQVALGLIGLNIIRRLANRWLLKANEHSLNIVLDWALVGLILIGMVVSYSMKSDEELEAFSAVIDRAYSDETAAIDELQVIAETPTHRFRDRARGVIDSITRTSITFPQNPAVVEQLLKLSYAELLQYYRQTPQHSAFVLIAIGNNNHLTEDDKANFMALMTEDHRFRVAQRACLWIRPWAARYQQAQPTAYEQMLRRCELYGGAWANLRL